MNGLGGWMGCMVFLEGGGEKSNCLHCSDQDISSHFVLSKTDNMTGIIYISWIISETRTMVSKSVVEPDCSVHAAQRSRCSFQLSGNMYST